MWIYSAIPQWMNKRKLWGICWSINFVFNCFIASLFGVTCLSFSLYHFQDNMHLAFLECDLAKLSLAGLICLYHSILVLYLFKTNVSFHILWSSLYIKCRQQMYTCDSCHKSSHSVLSHDDLGCIQNSWDRLILNKFLVMSGILCEYQPPL